MSKNQKIIELINSNAEISVVLYGKIFRCKIESFTKEKDKVLIYYDFTNTGKNYFYTTVDISNLILWKTDLQLDSKI